MKVWKPKLPSLESRQVHCLWPPEYEVMWLPRLAHRRPCSSHLCHWNNCSGSTELWCEKSSYPEVTTLWGSPATHRGHMGAFHILLIHPDEPSPHHASQAQDRGTEETSEGSSTQPLEFSWLRPQALFCSSPQTVSLIKWSLFHGTNSVSLSHHKSKTEY